MEERMKKRQVASKFMMVAILVSCLLVSSCAPQGQPGGTYAREAGAGVGALAGAILGQAVGHNTAGTIIGAAAGGLLGLAIGSQVHMQSTRMYDESETRKLMSMPRKNSKLLEIQKQVVTPKRVRPGDKVTVRVVYVVIDSGVGTVPVRETKTLWFNGRQQEVFDDSVVARENGTWESSLEVQVSSTAHRGNYTVCHDIAAANMVRSAKTDFVVM